MSAAFRFVLLLAVSDLKSTKNLFKNVQLLVVLLYFYPEIKSFFFAQGQSWFQRTLRHDFVVNRAALRMNYILWMRQYSTFFFFFFKEYN